jgi:hypothetical protein
MQQKILNASNFLFHHLVTCHPFTSHPPGTSIVEAIQMHSAAIKVPFTAYTTCCVHLEAVMQAPQPLLHLRGDIAHGRHGSFKIRPQLCISP